MPDQTSKPILNITTQIVAAHLANNQVDAPAIPSLIQLVHRTLSSIDAPESEIVTAPQPAVPVQKSVFLDFIICLEDGKKLRMLKRYLQTQYGMTPDDYRKKWGLPKNYPMVASNYGATRSKLAKQVGLGKTAPVEAVEQLDARTEEPEVTVVKAPQAHESKG